MDELANNEYTYLREANDVQPDAVHNLENMQLAIDYRNPAPSRLVWALHQGTWVRGHCPWDSGTKVTWRLLKNVSNCLYQLLKVLA